MHISDNNRLVLLTAVTGLVGIDPVDGVGSSPGVGERIKCRGGYAPVTIVSGCGGGGNCGRTFVGNSWERRQIRHRRGCTRTVDNNRLTL